MFYKGHIKHGMIAHVFFVLILVCLSLSYAVFFYFSHPRGFSYTQNTISVRIIESSWNKNIFSYEHFVYWNNNKWNLVSSSHYKDGEIVTLNGDIAISYFDRSNGSFEQYRLSQGFRGEIKAKNIISLSSICDSYCTFIKIKSNSIYNFKRSILNKTCYYWKKPVEFLYTVGPCEDISTFMTGLVIKDTTPISSELNSLMRSSGLSHIISVSGFQITALALFLELTFQKLLVSKRTAVLTILPLLLIYSLVAGFQPPIIRAFVSSLISLSVITFLGRKVTALHCLLYSSIIILIFFPHFITSYSFILSFVATLSIILMPKIKLPNEFANTITTTILSTVFAFLFTFPIVSQFGNAVNPILIILGSFILPFIPFITLCVILGTIPWIGEIFIIIGASTLSVLLSLLNELDNKLGEVTFIPEGVPTTILYYALLALLLYFINLLINRTFRISFFPTIRQEPE